MSDEGCFQLAMKALHESVGARVISCRAYVLSPEKSREGCEKSGFELTAAISRDR